MSATFEENLEERFEAGEGVLDYFETDVVLSIERIAGLSSILNLSALARILQHLRDQLGGPQRQ